MRLEVYDVDTAYKSSDASKVDLKRQDFQGEKKKRDTEGEAIGAASSARHEAYPTRRWWRAV